MAHSLVENKKKTLKETFSQALSKSGIPMTNDLYGDAEENVYKKWFENYATSGLKNSCHH